MQLARFRDWTLLRKFTVLSTICFAALGLALAQLLAHQVRHRALANTVVSAQLLSSSLASNEVKPYDLAHGLGDARMQALDTAVAQARLQGRIARLKVWNRDGTIVYSDDHSEIGHRFEVEDDLRAAFGGRTHAAIATGKQAEQRGERGLGTLLEAYVPLRLGDGPPAGAFEIYLPYGPVASAAAADVRKVYLLVAGGLGLLLVLLLRIVGQASRTLRRQAEDNRRQALEDPLTGLPNRRAFYERLAAVIESARADGSPVALLLADLNGFKELNDTLGHHAGDAVLSQLGPRVRAALPEADMLARIGGDEFAILVCAEDVSGPAAAAERFCAALAEPFSVDGVTVKAHASVGIARFPDHGRDPDSLMQRADVAMYQAKLTKREWLDYEPGRDEHSRIRLALAAELRRAISEGELVVHYQPKADLERFTITGVEALVRWQHPEHGLLPPSAFVAIAAQTGQIRELTLHVLETAIRQASEWLSLGLELDMAVNLAMENLVDTRLPGDLAALLDRYGLPAEAVVLEITEDAAMSDPARTLEVLGRLRELGVRLSLDDFGVGHSSLAYLRRLPVDELKIDRSFVSELAGEADSAAIVQSTIQLAHALGLRTVAEGVEDADTLFELRNMGADAVQGFYLGRPVPPAEVMAMLMHRFRDASVRDGA